MPVADLQIASHFGAELVDCGRGDEAAVLLRTCRIPHRRAFDVASVADQLAKKADSFAWPLGDRFGFGESPRDGKSVAGRQIANVTPSCERPKPMVGCSADGSAAREAHFENRPSTDCPNLLGPRGHDAVVFDRENLWAGTDEFGDGHAASIRETNDGISGHAFAKGGELGLPARVSGGA